MNKSDKIYVAGHRGMVGSAIVRKLQSLGFQNLVTRDLADLDLMRQADVEAFFAQEKPACVFLAAARVGGIMANNSYRAQFIYENLMIQNNVVHAAWQQGAGKLLFLGSSCIYPRLAPQPINEEALLTGPLEQTNEPYALAKIAGIKLCESYNRQYGTRFMSVMPTNLFGPNDNFDLETSHVLPAMIRKTHLAKCLENNDWEAIRTDLGKRPVGHANGQSPDDVIIDTLAHHGITTTATASDSLPSADNASRSVVLTLWGSGAPMREFLHVDDLADAVVYIMQHNMQHDLYNIGAGKDMPVSQLAALIGQITGYRGEINWDRTKLDGTPRKLLDTSRLSSEGWSHNITLEQGIRDTYNWYLMSQGQKV